MPTKPFPDTGKGMTRSGSVRYTARLSKDMHDWLIKNYGRSGRSQAIRTALELLRKQNKP